MLDKRKPTLEATLLVIADETDCVSQLMCFYFYVRAHAEGSSSCVQQYTFGNTLVSLVLEHTKSAATFMLSKHRSYSLCLTASGYVSPSVEYGKGGCHYVAMHSSTDRWPREPRGQCCYARYHSHYKSRRFQCGSTLTVLYPTSLIICITRLASLFAWQRSVDSCVVT
ncbi:hypothetical protein PoB_000455600 [Plakobranchus ocellatus]|uniref:Uncharacterized protein n=1 Tax=Plakobranchus ocellatus TaxID=259542 RepID=A0AAV3XRC2_9GAST|nr:hypothetical protein PoB_000455600 [Plakobranchus ocellatus]